MTATYVAATPADEGESDESDGSGERARLPRWWLDVAIGVALVILVGMGALRWLDSTAYLVVVIQSGAPFVVVGLILLTAATVLLRRWWMVVPVVAALTVAMAMVVPTYRSHASPKADRDLTVMAANLRFGQANPLQLMDAVRYHSVDVLVLTEATPDAIQGLDDDGATAYFTQRVGTPRADTYTGTMILSRYPLSLRSAGTDPAVEATPSAQPEVDVTVAEGHVRLKVAHPMAPVRGATHQWHAGLQRLDAWKDAQHGSEPVIVAGDFNAAFGHPVFRDLATGLMDAQREAGQGWVRTWPYSDSRMPPYVQIDHVLSRGLTLVEAGEIAYNRADHAAVWASYALPRAG
jgi:endonuclease/exonuclease/phosphatase (EEP) superfamily protein YafD